ncbi:MAG: PQQ-binding-like beta-propeller repeat protein, partial [Gemmataceae bacterium]
FDAATGKPKWKAPRKAFRSCYSTPFIRTPMNQPTEVVVSSTAGVAGYDAATGKEIWAWAWPFDGTALRTVSSPILIGDKLLACAGDGSGSRSTVCLQLHATGTPTLLWEKKKECPYVPGCVAIDGTIYWVTDTGVAMAVDATTGQVHWTERAVSRGVSASMIAVGKKLLIAAEDGKLAILKADPANFEKLGEGDLGEALFASPAVTPEGDVLLRTAKHLQRIGAGK